MISADEQDVYGNNGSGPPARIRAGLSQPSCPAFAVGTRLVITMARAGLDATQLAREPLTGSVFETDAEVTGVPVGRSGVRG